MQTWPGNLRHVVMPDIVAETRWLRSPYVGVVSLSVRKQMSYSASLSIQNVSSVFSTSWWTDRVALYGSTTVSDTCTQHHHHLTSVHIFYPITHCQLASAALQTNAANVWNQTCNKSTTSPRRVQVHCFQVQVQVWVQLIQASPSPSPSPTPFISSPSQSPAKMDSSPDSSPSPDSSTTSLSGITKTLKPPKCDHRHTTPPYSTSIHNSSDHMKLTQLYAL